MFVKICGITRLEDARGGGRAGRDALGFVFWPGSPRFIDPYRARAIVAALPPFVTTVGVFVNQPAELRQRAWRAWRASASCSCTATRRRRMRRTMTRAGDQGGDARAMRTRPTRRGRRETTLLLDAHDPVRRGGTGATVDWTRRPRLARTRAACCWPAG